MTGSARQRLLVTCALACLAAACTCETAWAQASSPRTVLTVHGSSEDFPGNQVSDAAIRKGLLSTSELQIDYYAEYLESDRFPAEQASLALRDYMARKYQGRRIDVVVAVNDVALQFVLRHRGELFPDAPIVFLGSALPGASIRNTGAGITGVVFGSTDDPTLELALQLHPLIERVLVVAHLPDRALEDRVRAQVEAFRRRIELELCDRTIVAAPDRRDQGGSRALLDSLRPVLAGGSRPCPVSVGGRGDGGPGLTRSGLRELRLIHRVRSRRRHGARHASGRNSRRRDRAADSRGDPSPGYST